MEQSEIKEFSETLAAYKQAVLDGNKDIEQDLEQYLYTVYWSTNAFKLKRALEKLNGMDLPEDVKQSAREVVNCAVDIAEHLDPRNIDSFNQIEEIVASLLETAKGLRISKITYLATKTALQPATEVETNC